MRRGLFALIVIAVLSIASISGVVLSGAVFTNEVTNAQSASAAADYVAPTATAAVIARQSANKPGYIKSGATYFAYANVSEGTGGTQSGIQSVTADLSNVSNGATSVALAACSSDCTVNGVTYGFKSASQTADAPGLTQGSKQFTLTTTDAASNARAGQSFNVTIDDTDPAVSAVIGADGSSTPGYVHANGGYHLFANVTDNNGAGAIDTVTGSASAITSTATSVPLTACSSGCSIGGTTYAFKSALLTADSGLTDGATPGFDVVAADIAGNTDSDPHTATVDNVAPSITGAAIQKSAGGIGGFVKQGGSYFAFANASDTSTLAITADVSSISGGANNAVALPTCSSGCTVDGISYGLKSASRTVTNPLAAGSYAFSITATDAAGNSTTQGGFNVTVDNTPPAGATNGVAAANGTGTAGQPDEGDTITFTTSEQLDPNSILALWTGSSTNVVVRLNNQGSNDRIQIWNSTNAAQLPLGEINANGNYVTGDITFGATSTASTMTQSGSTITVTLGHASGTASTLATTQNMTWSPSATATDRAGNAMPTSGVLENDNDNDF